MQTSLAACICDVCRIAFPSKAQMLVHQRDEQKYVRHEGVDIEELIKVEHDSRVEKIAQVIDSEVGAKEYKVIFNDGSVDWITIIDDSNPKVRKYLQRVSQHVQIHTVAEANWMNPIWENDY